MAEATDPVRTDRELTMSRGMVEAIATEMRDDEEVFVMGEDVAHHEHLIVVAHLGRDGLDHRPAHG